MTSTRLVLLGLLALAASAALTAPRATRAESLISAASQSLGGTRVFIVDVLYLRAEQARALGDVDDAASLYQTLLQMQPDNAPAAAHLVNIEFDLLGYVVDADKRFEKWKDLRNRLAAVIALRPNSARLRYRDAQLILDVLRSDDVELATRVTQYLTEPRFVALMRSAEACLLSDVIPRLGSSHIDKFAFLVVEVAADMLARGEDRLFQASVAVGREVAQVQDEMLGLQRYAKVAGADPLDLEAWVTLRDLVTWGLDTLEAVAAAPSAEVAQAAVDVFVERVGDDLKSLPRMRAAADRK